MAKRQGKTLPNFKRMYCRSQLIKMYHIRVIKPEKCLKRRTSFVKTIFQDFFGEIVFILKWLN